MMRACKRRKQGGAAMIEFALSLSLFWIMLIAVVEFARAMMAWNTSAEATRIGARLAAICTKGSEAYIEQQVVSFVQASGQISTSPGWIVFSYYDRDGRNDNCDSSTCTQVEVSLQNLRANLLVPLPSMSVPIPPFRTRLIRESMAQQCS